MVEDDDVEEKMEQRFMHKRIGVEEVAFILHNLGIWAESPVLSQLWVEQREDVCDTHESTNARADDGQRRGRQF